VIVPLLHIMSKTENFYRVDCQKMCFADLCLLRWNFGVSEVVAVLTVTAAALGDKMRNPCDQNDVQLMMTDRPTDMPIHTEFHQPMACRKNQLLTVEDPQVQICFQMFELIKHVTSCGILKVARIDVWHHLLVLLLCRVQKNLFFLKKPNPVVFIGFWVFLDKQEK